jgi:hypothetical protein
VCACIQVNGNVCNYNLFVARYHLWDMMKLGDQLSHRPLWSFGRWRKTLAAMQASTLPKRPWAWQKIKCVNSSRRWVITVEFLLLLLTWWWVDWSVPLLQLDMLKQCADCLLWWWWCKKDFSFTTHLFSYFTHACICVVCLHMHHAIHACTYILLHLHCMRHSLSCQPNEIIHDVSPFHTYSSWKL